MFEKFNVFFTDSADFYYKSWMHYFPLNIIYSLNLEINIIQKKWMTSICLIELTVIDIFYKHTDIKILVYDNASEDMNGIK